MPRKPRESLLDRLERIMFELCPGPAGGGGDGPCPPTRSPACPPVVIKDTIEVLVKLGMYKPDAVRRAHAAALASGTVKTTVQDLINAVFAQAKGV